MSAATGDQAGPVGAERSTAPALRLEHVDAGYGRLRVLEDISLEVGREEVVGVLGANGAGKTTLLRAIAGVIRPRAGTIAMFGERIDGRSAHELTRTGIGHVPSGRELFAEMSVEDNLQMGGYGTSRDRRKELHAAVLDLFPRLGQMLKRRAGALSGGEQQMLAVGRALMTDPRVLLLDEPSTGLAPRIVSTLFDGLRRLIERGDMSILLVEQNAGLALSVSRRAYVLDTGRCVLSGTAREIREDERVVGAYLGGGA